MVALSKTALKNLWKSYFQPTSADFSNLIDSWADYQIGLQTLGQAVSATQAASGAFGVVEYLNQSTVVFRASGFTGRDLLATNLESSARSVIVLGPLATTGQVNSAYIAAACVSAAKVVANSLTLNKLARSSVTGQSIIGGGSSADSAYGWTGVVQVVHRTIADVTAVTLAIPYDNTPPLTTEGNKILTASITPRDASSVLKIEGQFNAATSAAALTVAIFVDTSTTCLAAVGRNMIGTSGAMAPISIIHYVTAASTNAREYSLAIGPSINATTTINGEAGVGLFGGTAISFLTVTEILPRG